MHAVQVLVHFYKNYIIIQLPAKKNLESLFLSSGECYAGFYCTLGASSPAPQDDVTGNICPPGSYCEQGSPTHVYCPNGTYTNYSGADACDDCPQGRDKIMIRLTSCLDSENNIVEFD